MDEKVLNGKLAELIELEEKYIWLLTDELEEASSFACHCGWESERIEEGKNLRKEIARIKDEICKL